MIICKESENQVWILVLTGRTTGQKNKCLSGYREVQDLCNYRDTGRVSPAAEIPSCGLDVFGLVQIWRIIS